VAGQLFQSLSSLLSGWALTVPGNRFFGSNAQEKNMYFFIECRWIFEYPIVCFVQSIGIDHTCTAESANIGKFIQIVQSDVQGKKKIISTQFPPNSGIIGKKGEMVWSFISPPQCY
jgi:hypothetical protein